MTMPQSKLLFSWDDAETLPDLQRVRFVLDHLPDQDIIAALSGMRGRGRNDFPVRAMWKALVAGIMLQHRNADTGRMERVEKQQPMRSPVPNAWAFSRFMANVVRLELRARMISGLVPRLRRELMRALPDCGRFLGANGKAIRSHSSGLTLKGGNRTSETPRRTAASTPIGAWASAPASPGSASRVGSGTRCI